MVEMISDEGILLTLSHVWISLVFSIRPAIHTICQIPLKQDLLLNLSDVQSQRLTFCGDLKL